ncbi:hypothetical protein Hanom_Chr09g00856641 [Helianthus anomalus]
MNRVVNHPILKFEEDTYEWDKFNKFKSMALLQHRVINWEWLTEIGAEQEVRELSGERLIEAMNCIDPQYVELVLEFHSTWMHKEGKFEQGNALSFSFGRKVYEMNVPRFAIISGLYTEDEVRRPEFSTCLRGAYSENRKYSVGKAELKVFWVSRPPARFDPFQEPRDSNPAVFNLGNSGSLFKTGSFSIKTARLHNLGIKPCNLQ